jgi:cytochrome c biogenesis protein CcmG/thiol:disulfide interchange protein DsbE
MGRLRSSIATLGVVVSLALTLPVHARQLKIGEPAPNFELTLFNGQKVNLDELRGQVIVLNFWATWCVPCRTELPTLNAYYTIQRQHGMRVFAVATEDSVPERKLRLLFDHLAIEPVHRIKGPYAPLSGVPTNFVIDRAGIVRYAQAGAMDLDKLNEVLIPLLNQPKPRSVAASASR